MQIEFGAIDHIDRQDRPIHETFDSRLKLIELYEKAGFYAFHLTEHHFTPLGLSPSPNVFLAAASRITKTIRFNTLVYILPTYHPLRLAEEICMLDHLTHGRFEIGAGRGISPFEVGYFNVNHLESRAMFGEAWDVLMQALTKETVNFQGKYFQCYDVPMVMKPYQLPHPPLWQAPGNPEGVANAARNNLNVAFNRPANVVKPLTDLYRKVWTETHGGSGKKMPKIAVGGHLYVGETDEKAKERALFGYEGWYKSFIQLWRKFVPMVPAGYNPNEGPSRVVIAGTPATVREGIEKYVSAAGCNYFLSRFAYGELPHEESAESLGLFSSEVMPHFRDENLERMVG